MKEEEEMLKKVMDETAAQELALNKEKEAMEKETKRIEELEGKLLAGEE